MALTPAKATSATPPPYLPIHDPDALRYQQYVTTLYAHDLVACGVGALHIGAVPPAQRTADTIAAQLDGPGHDAVVQAVITEGVQRAEPALAAADLHRRDAQTANDQLDRLIHDRESLPAELVPIAGAHMSRQHVRDALPAWQQNGENRALAGDAEHENRPGRGWIGWILAVIVAVIEAGITIRIFNVSFSALSLSALTWLGVTAALVFFNHLVVKEAGRAQRNYREIRKQNRLIAEHAIGTTHTDYYGGTR